MTKEKILSHSESLEIITEIIRKTKDDFRMHSSCFLLWGWLIATANFAFFILHEYTSFLYYFLPFPMLVSTGIAATFLLYKKRRNESLTETHSEYFFNRMWLVLGISFILIVFISLLQQKSPFTYTLIIAGIGTLTSGLLMKFRPLIAGGILFFTAAISSVYFPENYKPLIFGAAIIAGYLIPGYLLKFSKK